MSLFEGKLTLFLSVTLAVQISKLENLYVDGIKSRQVNDVKYIELFPTSIVS